MICTCQWEGHETKTSTPDEIQCYVSAVEKSLGAAGQQCGNAHKPQVMSDERLKGVKQLWLVSQTVC